MPVAGWRSSFGHNHRVLALRIDMERDPEITINGREHLHQPVRLESPATRRLRSVPSMPTRGSCTCGSWIRTRRRWRCSHCARAGGCSGEAGGRRAGVAAALRCDRLPAGRALARRGCQRQRRRRRPSRAHDLVGCAPKPPFGGTSDCQPAPSPRFRFFTVGKPLPSSVIHPLNVFFVRPRSGAGYFHLGTR